MRNSLTGTAAKMFSEITTIGSKGDSKKSIGLADWKTKISAGV